MIKKILITCLVLCCGCSSKGLISEKYSPQFYKVPHLLPEKKVPDTTVSFIIYSDNQAGWRFQHKFLNKESWATPKLLIFPFYELYLIGNGILGGINSLRYMPDYGHAERLMVRDAIYRESTQSRASFILNVGDITAHDGRYPSHWALFLEENKITHPLLNEIPYFPVIGNHEIANDTTLGFANFQTIFDYPRFYVIELANAAIYVLDSNFIIDQNQFIDDVKQDMLFRKWFVADSTEFEISWLEQQFQKFDKPFKIVAMHHPPISFNAHHNDWYNHYFGNDLTRKRQQLISLFQRYHVQVVFSGHDHTYQHNILNNKQNSKIHFIVGGGGGAPLRKPVDKMTFQKFTENFKNENLNVCSVKTAPIYHYFLLKQQANNLNIKVMEVSKDTKHPLKVFDEIEITEKNILTN